jgi:hypothetical protein
MITRIDESVFTKPLLETLKSHGKMDPIGNLAQLMLLNAKTTNAFVP